MSTPSGAPGPSPAAGRSAVPPPATTPWAAVGVAPPSRPSRRRRPWGELAVTVAVAAAVAATLVWSGVIPLHAAAAPNGVAFSDARESALSSVSDLAGGPWTVVVGAIGLDLARAANVSTANVTGLIGANCTFVPLAGVSSTTLSVPGFSGSFASGLAPFWLVIVTNATRTGFVAVEVEQRTTLPLGTLGGAGCLPSGSSAKTLPAGVVDSPDAVGVAWTDYGSSWVAVDHNLTSQVMVAFPGGSFEGTKYPGAWAVVYAPCDPLLGGSTSEPGFIAAVGLTTGTPLAGLPLNITCPP